MSEVSGHWEGWLLNLPLCVYVHVHFYFFPTSVLEDLFSIHIYQEFFVHPTTEKSELVCTIIHVRHTSFQLFCSLVHHYHSILK